MIDLKLLTPKVNTPIETIEASDIIEIPIELVNQFIVNPLNALRDFASIPTDAITPFYTDLEKLRLACQEDFENPFDSFEKEFDPDFVCKDDFFRYMHFDFAKNKDGMGLSMCHIPKWIRLKTFVENKEAQYLEEIEILKPYFKFDFIGRIVAQNKQEIILSFAQKAIFELVQERNFYINLITFDRFESTQTIQTLREQGFNVHHLSVDRTAHKIIVDYDKELNIRKDSTDKQYNAAHETVRYAISEERIWIPWHEDFLKEAKGLEYISSRDLVMKSPHTSDDLLQSIAGSAFDAANNELPEAEEEKDTTVEDKMYERKDMQQTVDYDQLLNESNLDRYSNYTIGIL
jgi:hypothetical protein